MYNGPKVISYIIPVSQRSRNVDPTLGETKRHFVVVDKSNYHQFIKEYQKGRPVSSIKRGTQSWYAVEHWQSKSGDKE
jgi:hypothetical protein